jgi:hypothetical protein
MIHGWMSKKFKEDKGLGKGFQWGHAELTPVELLSAATIAPPRRACPAGAEDEGRAMLILSPATDHRSPITEY